MFFQFEIIINVLVSSSFQYLYYGSTVNIINVLLSQYGDRLQISGSQNVCKRQILTSKVNPRAVGIKYFFSF